MADKVCYFNNGESFRFVAAEYSANTGEVIFDDLANTDQLATAFASFTAKNNNASILAQMQSLENSVTERMKQEATAGSTNTFVDGIYAGKTALEAIVIIRNGIDSLRETLT